MSEYLYIRSNPDWLDKYKFGYTSSENGLRERYKASITEHSEYSKYERVFEIQKLDTYKGYKEFDKIFSVGCRTKEIPDNLPLLKQTKDYLVEGRDKSEFIKKEGLNLMEQIVKTEFLELGLKFVRSFSQEELREYEQMFQREYESENGVSEVFEFWEKKKSEDLSLREYQRNIIDDMEQILLKDSKVFLELATGGGKSFIVYNLFSIFKPETIIIFSPRKKINIQNVSQKYLKILNNDYLIFNSSVDKDFEYFDKNCQYEKKKKIIVACPQSSSKKILDFIQKYQLKNIFIWYDEAHHTVEGWVEKIKENKILKYLLTDKESINYRVFTSASPNKKVVTENILYFGKLYSPIKVLELINGKWLCPVDCRVFEFDDKRTGLLNWIIDGFNQNEKNFGFSFHSRDNNAFGLFYLHYSKFMKSETNIKPFLLIDQTGLDEKNKSLLKSINLKYKFDDVEEFETLSHSIAYVVKKYDMGYDFQDLDYIIISDPKISHKDIIQSIGRGTRSDRKGENGKNREKKLLIMLPTFLDKDISTDYKNVLEVLKYLILDLEIDPYDIFMSRGNSKRGSKNFKETNYEGEGSNKSKLLDLLNSEGAIKRINTRSLLKFCKKYNIYDDETYQQVKESNNFRLKNSIYEYPGFCWKEVIDPKGEKYYSTLEECEKYKNIILQEQRKKITQLEYKKLLLGIRNNGFKYLHKIDSKFPPLADLNKYYPK